MKSARSTELFRVVWPLLLALLLGTQAVPSTAQPVTTPPLPLAASNNPDDWVFAFKLNAGEFPTTGQLTNCIFGGTPQGERSSQAYAVARRRFTALITGPGLIGTSLADPVGATFNQIYRGPLNFVIWNDQFYRRPPIQGCGTSCGAPWGHSKGIIAWDEAGNGLMLQVTTPSWPASGSQTVPRQGDGNTLGCIESTNNVLHIQHFFALKLSPADTAAVLDALANASVATDLSNPQLARLGGPVAIRSRASKLGVRSQSTSPTDSILSTGVRLISKPSRLHVPPWQFLSARLGGIGLRTATWWLPPRIPTTNAGQEIICWRSDLGTPGRVEVALDGSWAGKKISLKGGTNHAKLGISIDGDRHYVIFGDLNQQGRLTNKCNSSQNGRGGLFFVIDDVELHASMTQLMAGETAPLTIP